MKKIIFLTPYPSGCAPSQRFRFEQYFSQLTEIGIDYEISSFWDHETWRLLYEPNYRIKKIKGLISGFIRRTKIIAQITNFEIVFIHRELTPIGPPVFEWIIAKVFKRRIIYDFDDAIWISQVSDNSILKWFRNSSKTSVICSLSEKVSVGNQFLRDYAATYNPNTNVVPTTIDTFKIHNEIKNQLTDTITIGWTGSQSTLVYLEEMLPIIRELENSYSFRFLVIANRKPNFTLDSLEFRRWDKNKEIEDLLQINIGLMPLPENNWTKGKCGLKALQYMALGIPALVSPVGVNSQIINNGHNGYICSKHEDWYNSIEKLINQPDLRKTLGENGRKTVEASYSVNSNTSTFLELLS